MSTFGRQSIVLIYYLYCGRQLMNIGDIWASFLSHMPEVDHEFFKFKPLLMDFSFWFDTIKLG